MTGYVEKHGEAVTRRAQAERALFDAVERVSKLGPRTMPPMIANAWAEYAAARDLVASIRTTEDDRKREENRARELHYVVMPGHTVTMCGLRVGKGVFVGWVGKDDEFFLRAVERGQNICAGCREAVGR